MLTVVALCLGPTLFVTYPPVAVKAADLHNSYAADTMDADRRYKDRPVTVQGVVLKVSAEGNRYAVLLSVTPGPGQPPVAGVACTAAPGSESEFRQMRPNDRVTLTG